MKERIGRWWSATHSADFELFRHFFAALFETEWADSRDRVRRLLVGIAAAFTGFGLVFPIVLWLKYTGIHEHGTRTGYLAALRADRMMFVTLSMIMAGAAAMLVWRTLLPDLHDLQNLIPMGVRRWQLVRAKLAAGLAFCGCFVVLSNLFVSFFVPVVIAGRLERNPPIWPFVFTLWLAGFFTCSTLALVPVLARLVVPPRWFQRTQVFVQSSLILALLCAVSVAFSWPALAGELSPWREWAWRVPAAWFVALLEAWTGSGPWNAGARMALLATTGVVVLLPLAALLASRRAITQAMESARSLRAADVSIARLRWMASSEPEWAVLDFTFKTLFRSSNHKVLFALFGGLALALILESVTTLLIQGGARHFLGRSSAAILAGITIKLVLVFFLLNGIHSLLRIPVELRANWVFRVAGLTDSRQLLKPAERILQVFGVAVPVIVSLPLDVLVLGWLRAFPHALMATLAGLLLVEWMLRDWRTVPFTMPFAPSTRCPALTFVMFWCGYTILLGGFATVEAFCLESPGSTLVLGGALLSSLAAFRRWRLYFDEPLLPEFEPRDPDELLELDLRSAYLISDSSQTA